MSKQDQKPPYKGKRPEQGGDEDLEDTSPPAVYSMAAISISIASIIYIIKTIAELVVCGINCGSF